MAEIIQVEVSTESGSILPERQWHEEIMISKDGVTLLRNGKILASKVNAGTWNGIVEEKSLQDLFRALNSVDCTKIKRIEPADPPDGGGTDSYILRYEDETTCSLYFDPGTSYENGDQLVNPIHNFLQVVTFPPEALNRYKE